MRNKVVVIDVREYATLDDFNHAVMVLDRQIRLEGYEPVIIKHGISNWSITDNPENQPARDWKPEKPLIKALKGKKRMKNAIPK